MYTQKLKIHQNKLFMIMKQLDYEQNIEKNR